MEESTLVEKIMILNTATHIHCITRADATMLMFTRHNVSYLSVT